MTVAVALAIVLQTVFGLAFDSHSTAAGAWPYLDVIPSHNWASRAADCAADEDNAVGYLHWASIWKPGVNSRIPEECENHPLLLGNEGHSKWQAWQRSEELAEALHALSPLAEGYCCGATYDGAGLMYTLEVLGAYYGKYGAWPHLAGLHIHVYSQRSAPLADASLLVFWRLLADLFGWRVAVSEYACIGNSWESSAACLPDLHRQIVDVLHPAAMFVFSDMHCQPPACRNEQGWPFNDLRFADGRWTPVGEAWLALTGYEVIVAEMEGRRLYAPVVWR